MPTFLQKSRLGVLPEIDEEVLDPGAEGSDGDDGEEEVGEEAVRGTEGGGEEGGFEEEDADGDHLGDGLDLPEEGGGDDLALPACEQEPEGGDG